MNWRAILETVAVALLAGLALGGAALCVAGVFRGRKPGCAGCRKCHTCDQESDRSPKA